MTVRGNPKALSLGPGTLFRASLGSIEPVNLITAWPAAFARVGYTEDGSSFSYVPSFDPVEVAEELEPLDDAATGRALTVAFNCAEVTAENLRRAMNGGTVTPGGAGADTFKTFEPPELGEEEHCMLGFESEDGLERWVWRNCKQAGSVEMNRRKGAAKTTINNSFRVYKPAVGKPFKAIIADQREVA